MINIHKIDPLDLNEDSTLKHIIQPSYNQNITLKSNGMKIIKFKLINYNSQRNNLYCPSSIEQENDANLTKVNHIF